MNSLNAKNKQQWGHLTKRLLLEYLVKTLSVAVGLGLVSLLATYISGMFIWQPSPFYQVLRFVKDNMFVLAGIVFTFSWIMITYRFIIKIMGYFNEIVLASKQLAESAGEQIVLSDPLKDVQDELNLVREQTIKNAQIAKDTEQRKNDLIVYLAHDLKTPLTSVIGYLSLLQDETQISAELRTRYTGIALNKAQRLEDLINEFFDITRFNLAHITLETERINLSRMLEQITYEFNPILSEKGLHWEVNLPKEVEIIGDCAKLERVLDNLIRNAIGYSYKNSAILISLTELENYVELKIQNSGKTIPKEKLERIFEQFFRIDTSRATTSGGAGLGLAIAKQIIELHGGCISAESFDESISFTVRLPGLS